MSAARNEFMKRCLAAELGLDEWRLAVALDVCILGFWDQEAGAYKTEARLGVEFLRSVSRLHGRSFERARTGLIAKGIIARFESSEKGGRGQRSLRSLYVLTETSARGRNFEGETSAEASAETSAKTSAPVRRRTEELEKFRTGNDDVVDHQEKEEELEDLLKLLGTFTAAQRETVRAAWTEKSEGVRALVEETFAARGVRSRPGLFMSRIAAGEHLTTEVGRALALQPLPDREPCLECNFSFGHRIGCSRGPSPDKPRTGPCPNRDCGLYAGRHVEGCADAAGATP